MKTILLVGDGMADRPIGELNERTVLEVAQTPYMDMIVKRGRIGKVKTIPSGFTPASDVANLSIMGYDPSVYYTGRGPLEAANMGIPLAETDVAFRCNTVTVSDSKMIDYSAGHITTKESNILIQFLSEQLDDDFVRFYPGVSYRHLMVLKAGTKEIAKKFAEIICIAPHDILGKNITRYLPKGKGREVLNDLMDRSALFLESHEVNKVRVDLGENPANKIWLWGQGLKPEMPLFKKAYGVTGSVISAVDLVNGIGKLTGLDIITVPGATGYYDTNFLGKTEYAIKSLENKDFVYVHVEAPDEAGHNGDLRAKITAVENFDRYVVGPVWKAFKDRNDYRMMVLPDHATPVAMRSHTDEPVPFAICGKGVESDEACVFTENAAEASSFRVDKGSLLINYLIRLKL